MKLQIIIKHHDNVTCALAQSTVTCSNFLFSEKMASEIANSTSTKKRASKRISMHFPHGMDASEELVRAFRDNPDAEEIEDDELKAMTMNMSMKRKLK